ncbi:MAG: hypothetical protein ACYDHH_25635 [Solirubrobacteraceae bacterium]
MGVAPPPIDLTGARYPDSPIAVALRTLRARSRQTAAVTGRTSLGRRELVLACVLSTVASAALFGPFVADGGRYLDDWWLAAYIHFPRALGFPSAYSYLHFYSGARPGAVVFWLLSYWAFGLHYAWHRALGVGLCAGLAMVFYGLLRELGLSRRDGAAITALLLVLPVADSIHFWTTPDVAQLSLAACAGGLLLAVRGLRAAGRRAAGLHLAASGLYVVSMLIAETMVPAIGLSWFIYRTQVDWRRALRRWAPDAGLVVLASLHYLHGGAQRVSSGGVSARLHHAEMLGNQALSLLSGTIVPFARSRGWWLVGLLALVVWIAVLTGRRRDHSVAAARWCWLRIAGLAAVFAAAAYVIYVPSDPSYEPLVPGVGNRVNIGALLPLSVLVYAIARLVGSLAPTRRTAGALTAALWGLALIGGFSRLEADRTLWDKAAAQQAHVLGALHSLLPRPPRGAAMLVFGSPGAVTHFEHVGVASVNESVPVFSTWWELDVAVKLSYGRSDLDAYPIWAFQPAQLACAPHGVYQLGLDGVRHVLAYGRVYVVDIAARRATLLEDQTECARIVSHSTTIRFDLPV